MYGLFLVFFIVSLGRWVGIGFFLVIDDGDIENIIYCFFFWVVYFFEVVVIGCDNVGKFGVGSCDLYLVGVCKFSEGLF